MVWLTSGLLSGGGTGSMVDMDIKTDETSDFIIKTFTSHFPDASTTFLEKVFGRIQDLFEGRHPGKRVDFIRVLYVAVNPTVAFKVCNS